MTPRQYAFIIFRAVAICVGISQLIKALSGYLWPARTWGFGMGLGPDIPGALSALLGTYMPDLLSVMIFWFGAGWLSARIVPRREEAVPEAVGNPGAMPITARDVLIPVFVIIGVMILVSQLVWVVQMLDAWYSPSTFMEVRVSGGSAGGAVFGQIARGGVGLLLALRPQWVFAAIRRLGAAVIPA